MNALWSPQQQAPARASSRSRRRSRRDRSTHLYLPPVSHASVRTGLSAHAERGCAPSLAYRSLPRGVSKGTRIATARAENKKPSPTPQKCVCGGGIQTTSNRHHRAWGAFPLFWLSARWQRWNQAERASNGLVEKTVLSLLLGPQRAMQLRNLRYWLFSWKLQGPLLSGFPPAGLSNLQKYVSALYAMHLKQMYLGWEKQLSIVVLWVIVNNHFIRSAISFVKRSQVLTIISWKGLDFSEQTPPYTETVASQVTEFSCTFTAVFSFVTGILILCQCIKMLLQFCCWLLAGLKQ